MKYIRTKNGKIYELQETKSGEKYLVRTGELIPLWNKDAYEILKQADNIEELCDWFVLKEDNKIRVLYDNLDNAINCEGNDISRYEIIGAIETDKGLIYVAKMNEKGELELL